MLVTANFNYQDKPIGISCTVTPGILDATPVIDTNVKMQSTVGIFDMASIGHENAKRRKQIESSSESLSSNNLSLFT